MSYFSAITYSNEALSKNPAGALRVAQSTTLFDGKILNEDVPEIFSNIGTGTGTYGSNKFNMSVAAGEYYIKQSRRFCPYFSGKPQVIEQTFDNFQTEANVVKRVGYFSSSAVAPYNTDLDGFFLEDDGITKRIKSYRKGTLTMNVAFASWDNYSVLQTYDWSKFTVIFWEFLWLGGAVLRLWIVTDQGFTIAHSMKWPGNNTDVFILSPNQPCRYEISSTTGSGSFRYICSQVSTEGSVDESGRSISVYNTNSVATNTVGVNYFLVGVRKNSTFRDLDTFVDSIGCINAGTADNGILTLTLNPTIGGAALVWNPSSTGRFDVAYNTNVNQVLTAGTGRVLTSFAVSNAGISNKIEKDYLVHLMGTIDNDFDELILSYTPVTTNQSNYGIINLETY